MRRPARSFHSSGCMGGALRAGGRCPDVFVKRRYEQKNGVNFWFVPDAAIEKSIHWCKDLRRQRPQGGQDTETGYYLYLTAASEFLPQGPPQPRDGSHVGK